MDFKKISVVIVTYNAEYYIEDCLESLLKIDYPEDKFKIIIVDNASKDFTMLRLNEYKINYPARIEICSSETNNGFAGGNNIGILRSIEAGSEYIYLLNQDTVVEKSFLTEAFKEIEKDENIAGIQSRLMLYTEKGKINSLGNQIHYLGFGITKSYKKEFNEADPVKEEICFPSGAACLLRASALKASGLFNEDFFMYCEDLELAWRMRLMGFRFGLAKNSVVYHKYKFSSSSQKFYYLERNRVISALQNYKTATLIILLPAFIFMEAGMLFYSALSGWFKEKLKTYFYFLKPSSIKKIKSARLFIKEKRVIPDNKIMELFISSINFEEVNNFALNKIANPLLSLYWILIKRIIFW